MFDFVTQKDIDALFSGDKGAPPPATPPVLPWSVAAATRDPHDARTALQPVFARFAQELQALLTARLQTPVEVLPLAVERVPAREFILSVETPGAAVTFRLGGPRDARGVLDLGPDIAFHLLDRLLGGPGDSSISPRPLTALEQSVLGGAVGRVLEALRASWSGTLPFTAQAEGFESAAQRFELLLGEGEVLVAPLEIRDGGFGATLAVALPAAAVAEALPEPTVQAGAPSKGAVRPSGDSPLESGLRLARLSLTARFPEIRLSARSLAGLCEGQVLLTPQPVDGLLEVRVNDRLSFVGSLGQIRQHVGVRIARSVENPAAEPPPRMREGRVL